MESPLTQGFFIWYNNYTMAQGKEFTKEQKENIIESLKPYLEAGLSRAKACRAIGFDDTTLSKWVKNDESLSIKLKSWENVMANLALANIYQGLLKESETEDSKKETSKWYLERRMKEDFSTRTEQTGADGKDLLPQPILGNVQNNNINKEDSSTK